MKETKAIYLANPMAYPMKYVIDMNVCEGEKCAKCVEACPYGAIDLKMEPETITINVNSIIWATGWTSYDAAKLENIGFGEYPNVITNVMMERLASEDGPTEGKIQRPSDQQDIKSIAFVQCAGSRDENHLPYCSSVCCAASLKQTSYVREQFPEANIHVFYIDIRTPGRLEDVYMEIQKDEKVFFHRGKVAKVEQVANNNLMVTAEDTLTGTLSKQEVDMVVLAVGLVPNSQNGNLPVDIPRDEYGFILAEGKDAMFGVGTAVRPMEVSAVNQDATGAVLKSIQVR
jgi:quinone-modifying oxidoreductase subunit QmoA